MKPGYSRAFWALFICGNIWLFAVGLGAKGYLAIAYFAAAIFVFAKDWMDRRFEVGPGRGDHDE